jgi:DNA-binding ferritin-like protein
MEKLKRLTLARKPSVETPSSMTSPMMPCAETAALVSEMLNSGTSIHRLHLKVNGIGSFSAHKALGDYYEAITGHADNLAEQYQGARESLLDIPVTTPLKLDTVDAAVAHLREMTAKVNALQRIMPFSEIVNQLDEAKSLIDSTKYKLLFLK